MGLITGIPELRHTFEYINRSTSMYFASSNIDLDSLLALDLSRLLNSLTQPSVN
jgi:hypothetical protein